MSSTAIQQRRLIWQTLSEFYLDTELLEEDLLRIARIFQQSSYHLEEIKEIDRAEVFPVLKSNLWSIAGNWTGFNQEWLFAECEKRYYKKNNILHTTLYYFLYKSSFWMNIKYWKIIEENMKK